MLEGSIPEILSRQSAKSPPISPHTQKGADRARFPTAWVIYSHRRFAPATGQRQECLRTGRKLVLPAEGDYSYHFLLLFGRTGAICSLGTKAALA
jgi:hypothetical protein